MKIGTVDDYRRAIELANELRRRSADAETDPELAEIESAIAAYEALPDQPGSSVGKPTPDPYDEHR